MALFPCGNQEGVPCKTGTFTIGSLAIPSATGSISKPTGYTEITSYITIPTGYKIFLVGLADFSSSNIASAWRMLNFVVKNNKVWALGDADYTYSNVSVNVLFVKS